MKSATLYYRDGASDKMYRAAVEPRDDLYVVTFAFGRRGGTMQTGTKTQSPVDLETAERIFDNLIREKTAKGYTPAEDGTPYARTEKAADVSGIRPQLLNAIDETEAAEFLKNPDWCMQEKKDGQRLLVGKAGALVRGINRRGVFCPVPLSIVHDLLKIEYSFVLDGELIGNNLPRL